jgi:hypothetical protein
MVMGICLALAAFIVPDEVATRLNFYSETLSPSSGSYELSYRAWDYPILQFTRAFSGSHSIVGNGTGTASLGMQYVARLLGERPPQLSVESGYGSLLAEFGIAGPVLWLLWATTLVISCWRVVLKLRQSRMFPLGFAVFWFALVLLFPETFGSINSYQDYVMNAMLWLLVGILYRLPELIVTRPVPLTAPVVASWSSQPQSP